MLLCAVQMRNTLASRERRGHHGPGEGRRPSGRKGALEDGEPEAGEGGVSSERGTEQRPEQALRVRRATGRERTLRAALRLECWVGGGEMCLVGAGEEELSGKKPEAGSVTVSAAGMSP